MCGCGPIPERLHQTLNLHKHKPRELTMRHKRLSRNTTFPITFRCEPERMPLERSRSALGSLPGVVAKFDISREIIRHVVHLLRHVRNSSHVAKEIAYASLGCRERTSAYSVPGILFPPSVFSPKSLFRKSSVCVWGGFSFVCLIA